MTSRPSRYLIRGRKVLTQLQAAPPHHRQALFDLFGQLADDPYPNDSNIAEFRGGPLKHTYVAWGQGGVTVMYRVAQDQPVIILIGATWPTDPDDNGNPMWSLAA